MTHQLHWAPVNNAGVRCLLGHELLQLERSKEGKSVDNGDDEEEGQIQPFRPCAGIVQRFQHLHTTQFRCNAQKSVQAKNDIGWEACLVSIDAARAICFVTCVCELTWAVPDVSCVLELIHEHSVDAVGVESHPVERVVPHWSGELVNRDDVACTCATCVRKQKSQTYACP